MTADAGYGYSTGWRHERPGPGLRPAPPPDMVAEGQVPLKVLDSPYREITWPVVQYLLHNQAAPG